MNEKTTANSGSALLEQDEGLDTFSSHSMADFDEANYLPMLDGLGIEDAQKRECLHILWNMMRMCIEMNVPAETWGQIVQRITEDNTSDSASIDSL